MEPISFLIIGGAVLGGVALVKALTSPKWGHQVSDSEAFGAAHGRAWRETAVTLGLDFGVNPMLNGSVNDIIIQIDVDRDDSDGMAWTRCAAATPPGFILDQGYGDDRLQGYAACWREYYNWLQAPGAGGVDYRELGIARDAHALVDRVRLIVKAVELAVFDVDDPLPDLIERARVAPTPLADAAAAIIFEHFSDDEGARDFLIRQLEHPIARRRLRAAVLLGARGVPILEQMALDHTLVPDLRWRAYSAAAPELDEGARTEILTRWLRYRDNGLAERALPTLARNASPDALAYIRTRLSGRPDIPFDMNAADLLRHFAGDDAIPLLLTLLGYDEDIVRQSAVQSLARFGDAARARAEAPLLSMLNSGEDEDVRFAADALGTLGTIAAVEQLNALTGNLFGDSDLEMAAETSIAAIKARAAHGDAGQLTLSEGHAGGELSVSAPSASGGLSETD